MVSNFGLYRSNEFIFQDYIYDDHGPNTDGISHTDAPFGGGPRPKDPTNPRAGSSGGQIRHAGDFFYPSEGDFYNNVADLIEFRVAERNGDVFYLFRLGALVEENSTVVGMCVDEDGRADTGMHEWPLGANLSDRTGCETFYTLYGTGAKVTTSDGDTKDLTELGGDTRVDLEANTIEMRVPTSVADPRGSKWRYYAGSGLWDAEAGSWLQVPVAPSTPGAPTATGGSPTAPQVWDLLSNNNEPNSYWREEKQANDLVAQDIGEHYVDVDFTRLAQNRDDRTPKLTGVIDRIYKSRFTLEPNEGIEITNRVTRNYKYFGRYQPYAVAIPSTYWKQAKDGARLPLDLCLHPLNGNHHVEIYYSQVESQRNYTPGVTGTIPQTGNQGFSVFEERVDRQNLVYACVNGRGEAVGYTGGDGMVDALEVYADVQKHYRIDVDRRTLHGISLGAIGTWYMSTLYPDRFSAALPSIFTPGFSCDSPRLVNLYNLPVFYTIGTGDQFGQGALADCVADEMEGHGNEFLYYHQISREHELSLGDEALPFSEPLFYSRERVRNPARVRYLFAPSAFDEKLPGDGSSYWVEEMQPRSGEDGFVDVTSLGRAGELPRNEVEFTGLYVNNPEGYQTRFRGLLRMSPKEFERAWRPSEFQPGWKEVSLDVEHRKLKRPRVANGFRLDARDLGAMSLNLKRMKLDPARKIKGTLAGDGALKLTLNGSFERGTKATLGGGSVPTTLTKRGLQLRLSLTEQPQALRISP